MLHSASRLIISPNIIGRIEEYFKSDTEKIMMLYIEDNKPMVAEKMVIPESNDYLYNNVNSVSLKSYIIASSLNTALKNKYSGLLILHNHVNKKFPLFSATDRYNHVKLWKFMGNKREGFIIASGVYANNMLAIKVGKQRRMIYVRIRRNDS